MGIFHMEMFNTYMIEENVEIESVPHIIIRRENKCI